MRSDRRWLWIYAGFLILLTTVPFLVAAQSDAGQWRFSGFLIGVEDGNSYIAKMALGARGDWLFRTPYTLLPQRGVLIYLPYLLLGKLASGRALHAQLVGLYHLLRVASIPVVVFATYRFLGRYLRNRRDLRLATALATVGGGLGWLLLLVGPLPGWREIPLSFISPEAFGFLASLTAPHLVFARAGMLLALAAYLDSAAAGRASWSASLWLLFAFLFNPLTGATTVLLIGLDQLGRLGAAVGTDGLRAWWKGLGGALRAVALPAPYVIYLAVAYLAEPFLRGWGVQNQIRSPHAGYYLLAYGWLLLPVALGIGRLWRRRHATDLFPLVWLLALPALAYAPVGVQRRLTDGVWVALIALAVLGADELQGRVRRWTRLAIVGLSLPTTVLLLAGSVRLAIFPGPPAFLSAAKVALFEQLSEQTTSGAVVFSDYETANALPAWAPVRVPLGHGPESVRFEQMQQVVADFFEAETETERSAIANEYSVAWVMLTPLDEAVNNAAPFGLGWQVVADSGPYRLLRRVRQP